MPAQPKPKRPAIKPKVKAKLKAGERGNVTPKPAKIDKPQSSPKQPPKKPSGRAAKHDWSAIRREYIRGDDHITYLALSQREGAPHHATIEKKAMVEGWTELRLDFRREVDAKLRMVDVDLKTEVRKRHAGMGKAMTSLGAQGLQALGQRMQEQTESCNSLLKRAAARMAEGAAPTDPEVQLLMERAASARNQMHLDTMDIVRFVKYGTDLERKALGMEEATINFRNIKDPDDLGKLGRDELWRLAAMLPPDEEDDEGF